MRLLPFGLGMVVGLLAAALLAASAPPRPLRPVAVTLHRFDLAPGQERRLAAWLAFLHREHRAAVASLAREHGYLEAMFTAPDEPRRLYWLTVEGADGASVATSDLAVDRAHRAYMDAVLVKGSHRRLATRNVLTPDAMIEAVRTMQAGEQR